MIRTSSAAYAHGALMEPCIICMELMEHLIAHTISGSGTHLSLTSHLIEACYLAGCRYSASLTVVGIFGIYNVSGGEAGAGGAGHGAGTAGDASCIIFLPHGMLLESVEHLLVRDDGRSNCELIFLNELYLEIFLLVLAEVGLELRVLGLDLKSVL